MSNQQRDDSYLADIEEACRRILDYTQGMKYEAFLKNSLVQDAVLRNFQIIGEAAKRVSNDLRQSNPDIPWREMMGMRDKVVHDYIGVNFATVWDTIEQNLPQLLNQVTSLLDALEE